MMRLNRKAFYGGIAGALLVAVLLVSALLMQSGAAAMNDAEVKAPGAVPAASLPDGLYAGNRFKIEIEGVDTFPPDSFWYVSGIEWKADVTSSVIDGTERKNAGMVHYAPNGITIRGAYHREIKDWFQSYHDGHNQKRSISFIILDGQGTEQMRYNVFEAWPSYYRLGPLSTGGSPGAANAEVILQEEFIIQVELIQEG